MLHLDIIMDEKLMHGVIVLFEMTGVFLVLLVVVRMVDVNLKYAQ